MLGAWRLRTAMKYTVSLLLLVAISHAAGTTANQEEDDNKTAKRELLEGNYGLRIQPSFSENELYSSGPQLRYSKNNQPKNLPSQDYGPPKAPQPEYGPPVAKISDVLTGQGLSFPAAIAGHLYSPVSVYQPRLGSPTTFEISQPIPSQLRYSEHKIFNDNFQQMFEPVPLSYAIAQQQNYERQEDLKNTNQNIDLRLVKPGQPLIITQGKSYENQENFIRKFEQQKNFQNANQNAEATRESNAKQEQQQNLQQNFPIFAELRPSRPDISERVLTQLEPLQPQTRPIYSEQVIRQIFPQIEGFPPEFFQQINQLGNQLPYDEDVQENIQYLQNPENEPANRKAGKENERITEEQNASQQVQSSTERQTSASQTQSSTVTLNQNSQPQAVSYSRFSQGLPLPSNEIQGQPQQILLQPLPSPSPLPQFQQLPQLQPPQLFQPPLQLSVPAIQQATTQPQLQPLPLQPLFQPLPPQPTVQPITSLAPLQRLLTVPNQSTSRIGVIRIRQGTNQLPQNQQTLTTRQPQTQQTFSTLSQNQQTLNTRQPQTQQTFSTLSQNQQTLNTRQPQTQQTFSTRSQNQQTLTTQQPQFPSTSQPVTSLNLQPSFASQELRGLDNEISTVSTTVAPRSTSASFSQSTESSTIAPVSIVPKFVSTLPIRPSIPSLQTSPPQILFTSTLPQPTTLSQPVTEAPLPTILTSIQPLSTLASVPQPQLTLAPQQTSEPQGIQQSTQAQILPTLQSEQVSTSLQPLPTEQPNLVTPQPLPTFEPIPVAQPQPQQVIPGIRVIPDQPYQNIQSEYQPLIQVNQVDQQQPLQLVQVQPVYPVQTQLQQIVSPLPQQLQTQFTQQLDQQQQSQYQSAQQQQPQYQSEQQQQSQYQLTQQQQSQSQSEQQQQSQSQSEKQEQSQSQLEQQKQSQSEHDKEVAIAHAQELLYELYTPFLQRPVYSEEQKILIQQPHFKVSSLAFPSSYSSSFPAFHETPAVASTQYFGKYAQNIFGAHPHYHHYKKK